MTSEDAAERIRSLELWRSSHDSWSRERHGEIRRSFARIESEDLGGKMSALLLEVGRLKMKVGFVLLLAGGLGGILGTVLGALVMRAFNVPAP